MAKTLSFWFSDTWLGSRFMLWSLFWINLLGTVYGYIWYDDQLIYTAVKLSPWYLPFVPDSPTASLFFTIFMAMLLADKSRSRNRHTAIREVRPDPAGGIARSTVEAFALITSFKYGIWAVTMIWAGAYQGDAVTWQDWMLTISHLGMAAEALLYAGFYRYRWPAVLLVGLWTVWNDYMDYAVGVFPWLPRSLEDDVPAVATFTVALSAVSILLALVLWLMRERKGAEHRQTGIK